MALVFADRTQETTTTTGTGTLTLAGAVAGYQPFSVVGNGSLVYYTLSDAANNWEVGQGTYTLSGTTLSRTTILASSNSGAALTLAAGVKNVFLDLPASFVGSLLVAASAKLAGNLDVNGHTITTGVTNGNVTLSPNGTGSFDFSGSPTPFPYVGNSGSLINVQEISAPNVTGAPLNLVSDASSGYVLIEGDGAQVTVGQGSITFLISGAGAQFGDGSNFIYDGSQLTLALLNSTSVNVSNVNDPSGNQVLQLGAGNDNYFTLAGGATGSPATVTLGVGGVSTNVNVNIVPKGTGQFLVNGAALGQPSPLMYFFRGNT